MFSPSSTITVVRAKLFSGIFPKCRFVLNVVTNPDTQLEHPLEFLGVIVPAVIVAKRVRWKIIIHGMYTAVAMR